MKIVILLLSLTSALADPTPCCAHHQFEADLLEVGGKINGKTGAPEPISINAKIYYDYDKKIQRVDREYAADDGNSYNVTILMDYRHKHFYSLTGGHCYPFTLTTPMTAPCVPASAKFMGTQMLGTSGNGIAVNTFRADVSALNQTIKLTVTADDCTPVTESIYGMVEGENTEVTYFFTNIKHSLPHNVFHIPPICHQAHGVFGKREVKLPNFIQQHENNEE